MKQIHIKYRYVDGFFNLYIIDKDYDIGLSDNDIAYGLLKYRRSHTTPLNPFQGTLYFMTKDLVIKQFECKKDKANILHQDLTYLVPFHCKFHGGFAVSEVAPWFNVNDRKYFLLTH